MNIVHRVGSCFYSVPQQCMYFSVNLGGDVADVVPFDSGSLVIISVLPHDQFDVVTYGTVVVKNICWHRRHDLILQPRREQFGRQPTGLWFEMLLRQSSYR